MRVMQLPKCDNGYWHVNIAPIGEKPIWEKQIMPSIIDVNDRKIFGYDETEFLRKQYR